MDESERLQRYGRECNSEYANEHDSKLSERIAKLLNHPKIDEYCMVDAYYYDFSVIPRDIQQKLQLWRDVYLIFGITTEGEIVSKWVGRYDLDSHDEIVNGKVIKSDKPFDHMIPPKIQMQIDPKLLSLPMPDMIRIFSK